MSLARIVCDHIGHKRGVCRLVAILAAFLIAATTCELTLAQGVRPPRTPTRPDRTNRTRPRPDAPPAEEPAPAEKEDQQQEPTYQEQTVDKDAKGNQTIASGALTKGKFEGDDKDKFDKYYKSYFLPQWSQVKNIGNLPKLRKQLRNELAKKSLGGLAVHDYLNEIVLEAMKEFVAGDFHPAVRVNAMLMIGDLNQSVGGDNPVPLPEALTFLVASAADGSKLPDSLRTVAMVGILRHARAKIQDDEVRKSLTLAMRSMASADLPTGPAGLGRAWIRMQAIETLGALKSAGDDNAVLRELLKNVADAKLPFFVRSAAVNALGELDYSSANGISAVETAAALGQHALDLCDDELRLAKKAADDWQSARKPGEDPQLVKKPATFISRRRMLERLHAVAAALKGIAPLAREKDQPPVNELQETISKARGTLESRTDEDKELKSDVVDLQKKLKEWLQKRGK
jgi:hypothetical protein